jgi:phosphopantothenoylcysteine decarboxylase / phosphopantothenate---cysteine ligase
VKRIVLIIGGGIAAYKCLELIRRAREAGHHVQPILTPAAHHFVTPLAVGALANARVLTELFDLDDEREIGHIRLARDCDAIVVAPATADLMARMAHGHANDLATAVLLATDKPVLIAPAMNPHMWAHPATVRNARLLAADGVTSVGPEAGEMAERGEAGVGRMAEPPAILAALARMLERVPQRLAPQPSPPPQRSPAAPGAEGMLSGRHVLVTSGPTHEPIDPVRYLANRSSGKQGYAIAAAAARFGAHVTLVAGPTTIPDPAGVEVVRVETAAHMLAAVEAALPADIAIFAAAVADWRVARAAGEKIKKDAKSKAPPKLELVENPDILRTIGQLAPGRRPTLVIGFAAETQSVIENAKKKRKAKGADWIVANDVSPATGIMGGDRNTVHVVTATDVDHWPDMDKGEVAERLVVRAAEHLILTTDQA